MSTGSIAGFGMSFLAFAAGLFVFFVGVGSLILLALFVMDISQTKQAIRRNYPVLGRLRYLFEYLGVFFRQYFFAMERAEKPFNRAERGWVYRAAKNLRNTTPFGSTRNLAVPGTILFANAPFALLEEEAQVTSPVTIGPDCSHPYTARSLFNISGMSYGAISKPAVLALSKGAHLAGCWLNTGEGGLSPWHLEGGADIVFQIGTAKYGVRDDEGRLDEGKLAEVASDPRIRMFEIKLSQGAKPGKGGILPAAKITPEIAAIRGIPLGRDSLSPNRHPEISNTGQLLDLVEHVRRLTGKPTGFKAVIGSEDWPDELCDEIKRRGVESAPDFITVDGAEGGSGAAPMTLIDNVGLPIRESLPMLVDKLIEHGLRDRVKVIASGELITPGKVAWALCVGADFVTSARGFMFALGCIQSMRCDKNTCPTGITTHNMRLQKGLDPTDKAIRVKNYVENIVRAVEMIAHSCGVLEPRRLVRANCRVVLSDGRSAPLTELHPLPPSWN
jgi:glutamate synthase domain-containing protein 2